MPEFLTLLPPRLALERLFSVLPSKQIQVESVASLAALGRVTGVDILAPEPLPAFDRSAVDGFAVIASDTYGAGESLPAYLLLSVEIPMGIAPRYQLERGQAAPISTGGMLPEGANAVVMLEHTQTARPGELEVLRPAAAGENVITAGEDVHPGDVVLPAGRRIRPEEIGGLMALGIHDIQAACCPRVGILSSGDEVVSPDQLPGPGKVRDVNSYALSALVSTWGGAPLRLGIVPDREDVFRKAARDGLENCDILVITAGSSASARDLTARVVDGLGKPGVVVHGVNVRPGKPTILAVCGGKPVIGLPGNPVSALVIARLFLIPLIERLLGLPADLPQRSLRARLTVNIPSLAGREDWIPAKILNTHEGLVAEPIFFKSNLIFNLARADGLIYIPADTTGFAAGDMIEIY